MSDCEPARHSDDLVDEEREEVLIAPAAISARCPFCNYDLSGLLESEEHRCPECGHGWTVEELARQHAAQVMRRRGVGRWLWVALPGPIACGMLFLGLVFGFLMWWVALIGTIGFVVISVVEWWQEAYRRSYASGRGEWNRYGYVFGLVGVYLFINVIEVALMILFVQVVLMRE